MLFRLFSFYHNWVCYSYLLRISKHERGLQTPSERVFLENKTWLTLEDPECDYFKLLINY